MNQFKLRRSRRYPKLRITIPNALTVVRILTTPLFVIFLIRDMYHYALLVFILAGVSDGLDGLIARVFNQRSDLGAVLDPTADKILLTAAYISLGVLKDIPGYVAVVVISRDVVIVTGIAVLSFMDIQFEIRPTLISKLTTACQILAVIVTLLVPQVPKALEYTAILYWITIAITVASGLHYTYIGLSILQAGIGANHAEKKHDTSR
jgi:cardiolipin synthase